MLVSCCNSSFLGLFRSNNNFFLNRDLGAGALLLSVMISSVQCVILIVDLARLICVCCLP